MPLANKPVIIYANVFPLSYCTFDSKTPERNWSIVVRVKSSIQLWTLTDLRTGLEWIYCLGKHLWKFNNPLHERKPTPSAFRLALNKFEQLIAATGNKFESQLTSDWLQRLLIFDPPTFLTVISRHCIEHCLYLFRPLFQAQLIDSIASVWNV